MMAMMVLTLKHLYHLPKRAVSDFLEALRQHLPAYGFSSLPVRDMPRDPRTYEKVIDLGVEDEHLIFCPRCSSSYPMGDDGLPVELHCISRAATASQPCGQSLCHKRQKRLRPILVFRRRRLNDWIQDLLGRPGNIEKMDGTWARVQSPLTKSTSDIWGANFVREMKGPDHQTPFSSIPRDETRLLFALAIDWFNPFSNKIAGKIASSGVMFMTCLNLPLEERFKKENIYFVGVMPGRKQQGNLDGILRPLVRDLLQYWQAGVHFLGIPGLCQPRLVRCALVQLICDLPAARKVAGFPSHNATCHCSVCFATRQNIADIDLAHDPALRRTLSHHMREAAKYKAACEKFGRPAAEKLQKSDPQAVRWSVLNDLPYWNPIECTVLDSMHLILLGLCQFHWRRFWGGDFIPALPGKATVDDPLSNDADQQYAERTHAPDLDTTSEDISRMAPKAPVTEQLSADKMNEARAIWVTRKVKVFSTLSIDQLLCLLNENGANMPTTFAKKEELAQILVARTIFLRENLTI
jgi:Transposase family tnp2